MLIYAAADADADASAAAKCGHVERLDEMLLDMDIRQIQTLDSADYG